MKPAEKTATYKCRRMPEILDDLFDKDIPGLSKHSRKELKSILSRLDGSGANKGMTCIASEEIEQLRMKIFEGVDENFFLEYDPGLHFQKSLGELMNKLNRSCDECSREDCENCVRDVRAQQLTNVVFLQPMHSRSLKTDLNLARALKPSYGYK